MLLWNWSVLSVLVATLVACNREPFEPLAYELADGASVRITIAAGAYAPGGRIPLAVHNLSDLEYVWNPCLRAMERRVDTGWVPVNEGERICTLEGWVLEPGRHTEATTGLATSLSAGEYRLRYGFARVAGEYAVSDYQVSNSFTVTP